MKKGSVCVVESYLRQSPLAQRALDARAGAETSGAGLVLAELPYLAKVNLRGKAASAAVKAAVGVELPAEPNTVAVGNNITALWLGPQEWLLVGPVGAERAITGALEEGLAGASVGIVDVTEGRTTIRVAGPMARDVLSMGCPLDLHPRVFGAGRCAQSFIVRSTVILHQVDDAPVYDVFVERSQSDYLFHWFETSGAPYGVAIAAEAQTGSWRRPARPKTDDGA